MTTEDIVFKQIKLGPMDNFSYVIGRDGEAVIVDPGFGADQLVDEAEAAGLTVTHVLVTHGHWDHVQEVDRVRERTGAKVVAHPESPTKPEVPVADGEDLTVANVPVKVVHTPGHEPSAVCFIVADTWLLTGDTLFIGECGRTDLPGSDPAAMWDSLMNRIRPLPGHLLVAPGHDYGPKPLNALADERDTNYTLEERSKDEFVQFMEEP